jgi:hypothetical protein
VQSRHALDFLHGDLGCDRPRMLLNTGGAHFSWLICGETGTRHLSLRVSMVVDLADLGTAPRTVPAIEYEAALRLSPDVAMKSNWQ